MYFCLSNTLIFKIFLKFKINCLEVKKQIGDVVQGAGACERDGLDS